VLIAIPDMTSVDTKKNRTEYVAHDAGPTVTFPAAEHSPSAGTQLLSRWGQDAELAWSVGYIPRRYNGKSPTSILTAIDNELVNFVDVHDLQRYHKVKRPATMCRLRRENLDLNLNFVP